MRQKHDDRRQRLGAYPRVDARPDLSDILEDQMDPTNMEAERRDETHEERGHIPSYGPIGENRMNADHPAQGFYYTMQQRRKGAIQ